MKQLLFLILLFSSTQALSQTVSCLGSDILIGPAFDLSDTPLEDNQLYLDLASDFILSCDSFEVTGFSDSDGPDISDADMARLMTAILTLFSLAFVLRRILRFFQKGT